MTDLRERFMTKFVRVEHGCWEWTAYQTKRGYGCIGVGSKSVLAHRVAWLLFRGEFDGALHVLHSCDNPCCVNPEHLFLGDHVANMSDMAQKGRSTHGSAKSCSKITEDIVRTIRERYANGGVTSVQIAAELGVRPNTISGAINGKSWRHVPMSDELRNAIELRKVEIKILATKNRKRARS